MNEIIEKVAEAIYNVRRHSSTKWSEAIEIYKNECRKMAKAAIQAMRENKNDNDDGRF